MAANRSAPPQKRPHLTREIQPARTPHPATVAQPRAIPGSPAVRPPHPATVGQPARAPHPATVAQPRAAAGAAMHPPSPAKRSSGEQLSSPGRALIQRARETQIEAIVGTRVWTEDFEGKHLAMSVEAAREKAVARMRREAVRSRAPGDQRHVSRNSVLIGDNDALFSLKEEVLSGRLKDVEHHWLETIFPLCLNLSGVGESWSHTVQACVHIDGEGNIYHLADIRLVKNHLGRRPTCRREAQVRIRLSAGSEGSGR
jgi:hypothetical protein